MALTLEELTVKANDMSLTVREAVEYALDRPNVSDNAKKGIRALITGFEKAGLNPDMPYADMRHEDNWIKLSKEVGGANRYGNFQKLEKVIRPTLQSTGMLNKQLPIEGSDAKIDVYPEITGASGVSKGTQRTGVGGKRPMRGLIPQDAIEQMYNTALPEIEKAFDQKTADALLYHKATFQRPEQLVGASGILKSDVQVQGDKITVGGITKGNKTRPAVTYPKDSEIGQLILRNLEASKSDKLFDVPRTNFDNAYKKFISPQLVGAFEAQLPLVDLKDPSKGVVSGPSATRHFMAKMLLDEQKIPKDIVEGMMGHTDLGILGTNYTGSSPVEGIGSIISSNYNGAPSDLAQFGQQGFAGQPAIKLTEEQQFAIGEEKKASAQLKALEANKERVQYLMSEEGQKFLQAQHDLEMQSDAMELERQQRKTQLKEEAKAAKAAEAAKADMSVVSPESGKAASKLSNWLSSVRKGLKAVGGPLVMPATVGLGAAVKYGEAEAAIAEGAPAIPTYAGKAAELLNEEINPVTQAGQMADIFGKVQPASEEEAMQDPEAFTDEDTRIIRESQGRTEKEDQERLLQFLEQQQIQP